MREALLIFRKDVRHLWLQILLAGAGISLIAVSDAIRPGRMGIQTLPSLAGILPLIAGFYLVVSLFHEEKTVGDTRYWLTRPFPRHAIVISKLLSILVFLYLPFVVGQMIAMAVNGIPFSSYWGSPAADTLLLTLTACLAAAAMATVASGIVEFIWATTLWTIGYVVLQLVLEVPDWPGLEVVRSRFTWAIMLPCGAAVVSLMYSRHKRVLSTGIVAASVVVLVLVRMLFPWPLAFALQERSAGAVASTAVRVAFDPTAERDNLGLSEFGGNHLVGLFLPVVLSGIPEGMQVMGNSVALTVEHQGARWTSTWEPVGQLMARGSSVRYDSRQRLSNGADWLFVTLHSFPDDLANVPAHLHATVALTLLGKPYSIRMADTQVGRRLPGDAFCAVFYRHSALVPTCLGAFSDPGFADLRWRDFPNEPWRFFHLPAPFHNSGGSAIWQGGGGNFAYQAPSYPRELYLELRQPIAYFERELDIPAIRLADFHKERR